MLMVTKSEAENSNILKLRYDSQGNGRCATDSQCRKLKSDGDPMAGTFLQTLVTAGDIASCVNGVLV